jgi:TDG/mug DNA glycosylase family protein
MDSSGFAPIAAADAKVLILGTLPGQVSLLRGQYYAHPQNGFWRIMEALFGISVKAPYEQRTRELTQAGIALWDVCGAGFRPGSLDSAIRRGSEMPNDFVEFLNGHPQVALICFNGKKARELFDKHVRLEAPVRTHDLPSTSAANARMSLAEKIARWAVIALPQGEEGPREHP